MKTDLSKKILQQIEEKHIEPKSKKFFLLKNYAFWLLVVFATFTLTFLFTVFLFHIQHIDFSVAEKVSGGKIQHFFLFFPYSLVFLFLVILIFLIENFLHTKYAYRVPLKKVFFSIFAIAFVFGSLFSFFMNPEKIENFFEKRTFGLYQQGQLRRKQMWVRPQDGLLAGTLLSFEPEDTFIELIDFSGKSWIIDTSGFTPEEKAVLNQSEYVAIQGEQQGEDIFYACDIREWEPRMKLQNERKYFELRTNECINRNK